MAHSLRLFCILSAVLTVSLVVAREIVAKDIVATTVVGQVNGAFITAREYVEALRRNRFRRLLTAEWRQAAWDECVRFKLVQLFACELGKLDNASEAALREVYERENGRRAVALARKQVVFGPRQLTWEQFRATWEDGIERDYGRRMIASGQAGLREASDEYVAFAVALRRAREAAKAIPDGERLARLDATTVLAEQQSEP